MKAYFDKDELQSCLKVLSSSVQSKAEDITSSVLFRVEEDRVILKGSNHHVYSNIVLKEGEGVHSLEGGGVFAVEEGRLSKWVSNIIEDRIEIQFDGEDAIFKCGSFVSPFPSKTDTSNFPSKKFEDDYQHSEVLSKTPVSALKKALTFINPMVSSEISSSDPTGKLKVAQVRGKKLLGTDTKLMGLFCCDYLDSDWKIGKEQLSPALKYLSRQGDNALVTIRETAQKVFFEIEQDSFFGFSKPIKDLPVFKGIPESIVEDNVWNVRKGHLKQAIGALLATAKEEEDYLQFQVSGTGEEGEITLKMKTFDGKSVATVDMSCNRTEGDQPLEFAVAHSLLHTSISSFGEDLTLAYNPQEKYLKVYEKTEGGDVKVCFMTLQRDIVL